MVGKWQKGPRGAQAHEGGFGFGREGTGLVLEGMR